MKSRKRCKHISEINCWWSENHWLYTARVHSATHCLCTVYLFIWGFWESEYLFGRTLTVVYVRTSFLDVCLSLFWIWRKSKWNDHGFIKYVRTNAVFFVDHILFYDLSKSYFECAKRIIIFFVYILFWFASIILHSNFCFSIGFCVPTSSTQKAVCLIFH